MAERVYNVLFLCTGNSARSIMAECAINRWGQGRFEGFSAGSHPKGKIHPMTLRLLERLNYRTQHLRSKSWDEFAQRKGPPLDFVFTLSDTAAGEAPPTWPGHPITAHWHCADPESYEDATEHRLALIRARTELERRLRVFANLPVRSLDRLSLQAQVDALGSSHN